MSTQTASLQGNFSDSFPGVRFVRQSFLMRWPSALRVALAACVFSTLVFIPYLGAVGLWDPWETHYGEVARSMIQRNDYAHPYWENAYFFSKPAFTMWMQALGLQAADVGLPLAFLLSLALMGLGYALYTGRLGKVSPVREFWGVILLFWGAMMGVLFLWGLTVSLPYSFAGIASGDGALPWTTEWAFRLPFAMFSILAVSLLAYALTIAVNARAALASTFVLVTMPLYAILSRQAVTDIPIVAATIAGISCAMVALFDGQTRHASHWWYASYVFFAIATLAKGLLGFGVPMMVFLLWFFLTVMPWNFQALKAHARWAWAHAAFPAAIALGVACILGGLAYTLGDRWDVTFMQVLQMKSNMPLLSSAVCLGVMWGCLGFWVAMTVLLGRRARTLTEKPPALFAMAFDMRLGTGILLFLAVCLPWYYEMFTFWRVDDESKQFWYRFLVFDHFSRLGSGVHTTTPGGDFTYFIQQGGYAIFPWVALIPGAFSALSGLKLRDAKGNAALIAVLWFAFSWALIGASATKFHHYVFPMLPPLAILIGLFIAKLWEDGPSAHGLCLALGVPILFLVCKDLTGSFKHFTDMFVYNYDRPYPAFLSENPVLGNFNLKQLLGFGTGAVALIAILSAMRRSRVALFATGLAGVLTFSLWLNWSHWVDLSHHWTQREQFWRYFTQRKPGEPIAAFLMNWRGETFYSRNTVKQFRGDYGKEMQAYAAQPGRKWSLVEHGRLHVLRREVGDRLVRVIDDDLNNKFVLLTIE